MLFSVEKKFANFALKIGNIFWLQSLTSNRAKNHANHFLN